MSSSGLLLPLAANANVTQLEAEAQCTGLSHQLISLLRVVAGWLDKMRDSKGRGKKRNMKELSYCMSPPIHGTTDLR